MKKIITVVSILCLLLVACNEDKNSADKNHHNVEHKQKIKDKSNAKQTEKKVKNLDEISDKTKLALAFFAEDKSKYIISKDEVLTGVYEQTVLGKQEKKRLYKLLFIKEKQFDQAPNNMKFYTVYPSKGSFATIVGLNKDKLYVGGIQGATNYKELLETGNEYNLKELYNKNKNYSSLSEIAKQIEFKKEHPFIDEDTRKEYESKEDVGTETHLRSQVYGMITDFEGKPLDNKKYLIDIVRLDKQGKWYVHYRNKNGEIIGTYTTKGNNIVKKDQNGKVIKEKHVENKHQ